MISGKRTLGRKAGLLLLCMAILPRLATSEARLPPDACSDFRVADAADPFSALGDLRPPSRSAASGSDLHQASRTQALSRLEPLIARLVSQRFPELQNRQLRLRTFANDSDYFRTRFSVARFLFFRRMRYFVEVNPRLIERGAPADGICGILGHELSHVSDMSRHNRLRLLGFVRLLSPHYTAKFERRADLEAIQRGFAGGLKSYRSWVYRNIPAKSLASKKRNYFSPPEIESILEAMKNRPELLKYWECHVPMNMVEIQAAANRTRN